MKGALVYFISLSSLLAFEGYLGFSHLAPMRDAMMLERQLVNGVLQSQTFWQVELQLEKRAFENLYYESRRTLTPAIFWNNFQVGLGLHSRSFHLPELNVEHHLWLPVLTASWRTSFGLLQGRYLSQDCLEVEGSIMRKLMLPFEFNLQYRRDGGYFDGSRFSLLVHLHSQGGIGARYYSKAETLSVVGWLYPTQTFSVRLEYHLPSNLRPFTAIEFSLEYRFGSTLERSRKLPYRSAAVRDDEQNNVQTNPQKRKIKAPTYAAMIRQGVDPIEALAIARARDICTGSAATRRLLGVSEESCQ